jgi:hypothetical protein
MEKSECSCDQYPPEGKVVFTNIKIEYDGQSVTPKWTTSYVDDHCNCRAQILSPSSVQITWNA